MADPLKLNNPWLVAVWPGMGHVGVNAGIYLLAKLGMTAVAEFDTGDLFDVDHVEVKGGIIQPGRRPRSRVFAWQDPNGKRDLLVFLGEGQPPLGKYPFCRQLARYAKEFGIDRVYTFAAMATQMRPEADARVFAAATDQETLEALKRLELKVLEDGNIAGLNGVLLGAAAEAGLHGACLLGEMPHIFAQLPFPKGSLAVLEAFSALAGIDLDLTELTEQARVVEEQLSQLLARVEEQYAQQGEGDEEEDDEENGTGEDDADEPDPAPQEVPAVSASARRQIERLFEAAAEDRAKAFELKQELDRRGLFKEYENRFLDLFKKSK